jgi:hypothetical protein
MKDIPFLDKDYISIISPLWKSTRLPHSEWLLHGSFHDCCEGIKGWLALHQAEVAEPQGEAAKAKARRLIDVNL